LREEKEVIKEVTVQVEEIRKERREKLKLLLKKPYWFKIGDRVRI
jgi:DNA mismatch repair protein MutS2